MHAVISGACTVKLDDGNNTEIHRLEIGGVLLFPKRTLIIIPDFEWDTILFDLSDKEYESSDYVADYEEFKRIVREDNV